jgi:hypothetical protein
VPAKRAAACLALLFALAVTAAARAGEEPVSSGQWRARGLAAARSSRPDVRLSIAARPAPSPGARAGLQWTSSPIPNQKPRRLDGAIRPVQHQQPAGFQLDATSAPDASESTSADTSDPAGDLNPPETKSDAAGGASQHDANNQPALLDDPQPSDQPTMPADDPFNDSPVTPADDLYKNDPIPNPPDTQLPVPSGDLSEGIETPAWGAGCKGYGKQCVDAIAELQKRDITTIVVGVLIEGTEGEDFPCDCKLGRDYQAPRFAGRNFAPTLFTWKASATCHKPLYFEDVQLERYGHSWNPVLQPFVSGAHFFVSVPLLPYKMGLRPPHECVYTLGYYRPGNCAPYMFEPIPLSLRAAVFEGFGAAAFAFWFWPPN